jgi:ribosomal protein S18 acetylase RimI-like enzyme
MLRDLRATDGERVFTFLKNEFPEEEALYGTRPEGVQQIIRRIFRWDVRFLLGLARALGRPFFRFLVIEADEKIVGTTLLSFPPRAGYLSMVVVDPAYRGRGLARRLIEEARQATVRRGRPYCVLDVLDNNTPARRLYDSSGYRRLRGTGFYVHESPASLLPFAPPSALRPLDRRDVGPLVEVAKGITPAEVNEVLPTSRRALSPSGFLDRALGAEVAAWVVDRGSGPEAYISASVSPATEAAHLSQPIAATTVPPELTAALVRTAAAWCADRKAPRVVVMVPDSPPAGRAAVEAVGFRHALSVSTLYRPAQ